MKVLVAFLFCLSVAESFNYTNFYLVKVKPLKSKGMDFLKKLETQHPFDYDFWIPPSKLRKNAEVLMPKSAYDSIKDHMKKIGIEATVLSNNIQSEIDKEKNVDRSSATPDVSKYVFIHAIDRKLKSFAENYDHISLKPYGKSHESRQLYALKFSSGPGRKSIIVEAGMHGRDWIAIAATMKLIEYMATEYKTNLDVQTMVNNFDWLFVPVANPDGYVVTYSQDRLWRKNMKRDTSGTHCVGVDLNRNFQANWGKAGSIGDPCNRAYRGQNAFSEPETVALSRLVRSTREKLAYFSIHAYSQYILTPYACKTRKPANSAHLIEVAEKVKQAIYEETGNRYFVGTPPDVSYPFTGSSFDWAKMEMNIKYAYTLRMGPPAFSGKGFIVPETEIDAYSKELYIALNNFASHLEK